MGREDLIEYKILKVNFVVEKSIAEIFSIYKMMPKSIFDTFVDKKSTSN